MGSGFLFDAFRLRLGFGLRLCFRFLCGFGLRHNFYHYLRLIVHHNSHFGFGLRLFVGCGSVGCVSIFIGCVSVFVYKFQSDVVVGFVVGQSIDGILLSRLVGRLLSSGKSTYLSCLFAYELMHSQRSLFASSLSHEDKSFQF